MYTQTLHEPGHAMPVLFTALLYCVCMCILPAGAASQDAYKWLLNTPNDLPFIPLSDDHLPLYGCVCFWPEGEAVRLDFRLSG